MSQPTITVINGAEEAEFWILPQTEENWRASLWGAATLPKLRAGDQATVTLPEGTVYFVRIIDTDHAFYAANGVTIKDGYTLRFTTEDTKFEATIDVLDEAGTVISTWAAFEGVLG